MKDTKVFESFVTGFAIGFVATVLFTPYKGRDARDKLKQALATFKSTSEDSVVNAIEKVEDKAAIAKDKISAPSRKPRTNYNDEVVVL